MRRLGGLLALALGACELGVPTPSLLDGGAGVDAGRLTVTIVPRGNGKGVVTLDPGSHACPSPGPPCVVEVAPGTVVHLTAAPAQGSAFALWRGVPTCETGECSFTVTSSVSVAGTLRLPYALAFVTSTERTPGSLGGLNGAAAECTRRARAGGYDGAFEALLGDDLPLVGLRGWVRSDGATVTTTSLLASVGSGLLQPIDHDELGQPAPEGAKVVTDMQGGLHAREGDHCRHYQLESGAVGYGLASATEELWVGAGTMSCGDPARLYCVQSDATVDPPRPAPPGAGQLRAFYYFYSPPEQGFVPGGGRPAADAACDALGDQQLGAGTYQALLATLSESATRRLPDGREWARFDGVPLGTSAELKAGHFAAPLNLNPLTGSGAFLGGGLDGSGEVWIGADGIDVPGTVASTCGNWAATTGQGRVALVSAGLSHFDTDDSCANPHGLWCLELPPP